MTEEKLEQIKEQVKHGFYFNRVPDKTKKEFSDWASDEFCGDRGMAFKHLWDFYKGTISTPNAYLSEQIEILPFSNIFLDRCGNSEFSPHM